jgi:hypothetical protein
VGNTLGNGYMRANGAIGISLRKHGKARGLLCQSTPCELGCSTGSPGLPGQSVLHRYRYPVPAGTAQ